MNDLKQKLTESLSAIRKLNDFQPEYAIVLGSGLKNLANEIDAVCTIPYSAIPHFPKTTVDGHSGSLVIGKLSGKKVVAMSGRFHYYEGYTMQEVTYPIRLLKAWNIENLLVSNASGGVNPEMQVGDLMIINDHINLQAEHPLRGPNDPFFGARFPDMLHAYDRQWIQKAEEICIQQNIRFSKGVYVGVSGPTFETAAEYKFFNLIGGDAVGMSTVPEVIVARHMNMRVFAVSVISDIGYPADKMQNISHEIVLQMASEAEPRMTLLLKTLLNQFV